MAESLPRLTMGELANRVLASQDDARTALAVQLARGTRSPDQIEAMADRFLGAGDAGRQAFLEWIARVRAPLPQTTTRRIAALLSDRSISPAVRIQAAARLLKTIPDEMDPVLRVARALTAGLSPLRRLERLRQLQHQVDVNRSLDHILERREARVKMDCPRCGQRFPRETMIRHLWHAHGLMLEGGKVRSPRRTVEELKAEHQQTHDTTVLDRASLLADLQSLRDWVAVSDPPAEDTEPLILQAKEHEGGLCPGCFAELAPPLAPLPPPLAVSAGRVAGNGYSVEVSGSDWFRLVTVSTPGKVLYSGPDGRRAFGSRGVAGFAAAIVLFMTLLVVLFGSKEWAAPIITVRLILAAGIVYGMVWFLRKPPPDPTERAIDAAWHRLARKLVAGNHTSAWLARLCRSSLGRGDTIARAGVLHDVLIRAQAGDHVDDLQLLAAANILQVEDGSRHGRDRVAGAASIAAAGFRGEEPMEYAEYAVECYLHREGRQDPGELARLRMLLLAAAYEGGLRPRDLIDLWAVAPNLRRAMSVEPVHRLALLRGIWEMRPTRRWERIAPAESVYDLCRSSPYVSGRILTDYPDLLLYHRPDPDTETQLGPVLICARGIALGGRMVADPDAKVELVAGNRGYELSFGPYRFALERMPVGEFAEMIREWLRFRAWALLPLLDNYLAPGSPESAKRLLDPFARRCRRCGTVSAVSIGQIGRIIG